MNFHQVLMQSIQCNFTIIDEDYSCQIRISNSNGLNNFTSINGTHMPGKTDEDVLKIDGVYGSYSTNIPSIICETYKNVQKIVLNTMGILRVHEYSFKSCLKLLYLDIYNNRISDIHPDSFLQNHELVDFHVMYNQLRSLPENVFKNQQKLERLSLYVNEITDLPNNVFKPLVNLKSLPLSSNLIKSLRYGWFENLQNIESLYFYNNLIEEIPENIFGSLKNLSAMSFGKNKLKIINSDSFGIHPKLINFHIFDNLIEAIDERLINNTGIRIMEARNNTCVNRYINDDTEFRENLRADLRTCFANFDRIMSETTTLATTTTQTLPPGCSSGFLNERICKLEDKSEEFGENFQELRDENQRLNAIIEENNDKFQNEINEMKTALAELQDQVLILMSRPCACK